VTIRVPAPAKVNLTLRILARETSGYHQLETVFLALELCDVVTVAPGGRGIRLRVEGPDLGPVEENLAYRAAAGFLETAGGTGGVEICLRKRIPAGSGLGGGSSDAAATLRALSSLFPGRVDASRLQTLAGTLGADVPFFLANTPMALAWGRGERLFPLPPLPPAEVLVAVPPVAVRTPEAYRLLARARGGRTGPVTPAVHTLAALGSWDAMAKAAWNDFESVIFREIPELARLKDGLAESGSLLSLLSGSGSALFAVFAEPETAVSALPLLEAEFPDTRFLPTRTMEEMPQPDLAPGVEP
jgi:4-diphosphocytidyl-2-C-methyl-D-erythritol kinase